LRAALDPLGARVFETTGLEHTSPNVL
jgi:hypothetical protein